MSISTRLVRASTAAVVACGLLTAPAVSWAAPTPASAAVEPKETGRATITHPAWGKMTLITTYKPAERSADLTFLVGDEVVHERTVKEQYEVKLASPAQDDTGNIFINYNPGRYNGVMVLRPSGENFTVLADAYDPEADVPRFYDAKLVGPQDGRYSLEVSRNDCVPGCATGTVTRTPWTWNGSDYVPGTSTTAKPSDKPKASASGTPRPKGTPSPTASSPAPATASGTPTASARPTLSSEPAAATTTGTSATTATGADPLSIVVPAAIGLVVLGGAAGYVAMRRR